MLFITVGIVFVTRIYASSVSLINSISLSGILDGRHPHCHRAWHKKVCGTRHYRFIEPLAAKDLPEARTKLSWIVGRDTEKLEESGIARGAIETVSENTADGITSPLFWAFLLGAPGLWLYKTVNTLDSMIGYKDERYEKFGKFSARADDLLNFIPATDYGVADYFLYAE